MKVTHNLKNLRYTNSAAGNFVYPIFEFEYPIIFTSKK